MEIEYASVALGLVSIGLFFLGFQLGKKSSKKPEPEPEVYDLSKGVTLQQAENLV